MVAEKDSLEAEEVKALKCPGCGAIMKQPNYSDERHLIDLLQAQIKGLRERARRNNEETVKKDVKLHEMRVILSNLGADADDPETVDKYSQRRVSKQGEAGLRELLFRKDKQIRDLKKNLKAVQRQLSKHESVEA